MKINLDRVYETYIRTPNIGDKETFWNNYINNTLRKKVIPLVSDLKEKNIINWFCFLLHQLPNSKEEAGVHLRIELVDDPGLEELKNILPDYCEFTRKLDKEVLLDKIDGINKNILKDSNLEEAWWIIGECSKWIVNMLNSHSDDATVPLQHVGQFLHYFANALQCDVRLS